MCKEEIEISKSKNLKLIAIWNSLYRQVHKFNKDLQGRKILRRVSVNADLANKILGVVWILNMRVNGNFHFRIRLFI